MWAREAIQPAMIAFLAANTLCVGLRVYVRTVISKSFGYDDYAMVFSHVRSTQFTHAAGGTTQLTEAKT